MVDKSTRASRRPWLARAALAGLALPRRLSRAAVRAFRAVWTALGGGAAFAVNSVRVPVDADAIDLTGAVEHYGSAGRPHSGLDGAGTRQHRAAHRGQRARSGRAALMDRVRADQRFRRAAHAPRRRARITASSAPASSGPISAPRASRRSPPARAARPSATTTLDADVFRLTLDPGTTVTYVAELRTANAAAALSLGARRLQGQQREPDALPGHRDRHRRPARAVPDDRVRRAAARWSFPRRRRWPGRCSPMSASTSDSGARFSVSTTTPSGSGARASRRRSARR